MFYLSRLFLSRLAVPLPVVVLVFALMTCGLMPIWSQTNGEQSNSNNGTLSAWESLFNEGQRIYEAQERSLRILQANIMSLEHGYAALTALYEQLSQSNSDLRRFNEQIGERMERRDMQLFWLHQELDELDAIIAQQQIRLANARTRTVIMGTLLGLLVLWTVGRPLLRTKFPLLRILG